MFYVFLMMSLLIYPSHACCVFDTVFQTLPNLPRPGERLTQRSFEEASLDAVLDVNKGLSQNPDRAADHLR